MCSPTDYPWTESLRVKWRVPGGGWFLGLSKGKVSPPLGPRSHAGIFLSFVSKGNVVSINWKKSGKIQKTRNSNAIYHYLDKMAVTHIPPATIRVINACFFETCLKVNYVDYLENTDRWLSSPNKTIKLNFEMCVKNIVNSQTEEASLRGWPEDWIKFYHGPLLMNSALRSFFPLRSLLSPILYESFASFHLVVNIDPPNCPQGFD